MSPEESAMSDNPEEQEPESVKTPESGEAPAQAGESPEQAVTENADSADPLNFGDQRIEADATEQPDLSDAAPDDLQTRLAEAEARANENWERVLRMQAELDNQRKRLQKDVENARKFALEGMVNDLLPVRDSLEMGIAAAQAEDADPEKIIEGSDLTLKMLSQAFDKYNIGVIDPIDQKFDPEFHQAMSMQEVEGKEPNTVTAVLQKGYTLNERLLRPALVMVAK